jgi:GTP-binding protein EngB required for normal cell division
MSLRSQALDDESSQKFIDPITLDIMNDPVIAEDGKTYDRYSITLWFENQKRRGFRLTSPLTGVNLVSDSLAENKELKAELHSFKASKSSIQVSDIKFALNSNIFKELDRIATLPQMDLFNLQPPKIVVIGNESHGKSTILERIVGLPIFPKNRELCTRCVIRVHLRRNPSPGIAEIQLKQTLRCPAFGFSFGSGSSGSSGSGSGSGFGFHSGPSTPPGFQFGQPTSPPLFSPALSAYPVITALDNIREKIQEIMDELVSTNNQQQLIFDNYEIVVKITLPYCLNLDLLDVPGLVTTSPPNCKQNLPQITHDLALSVIREQKDSAIFLLVNDIRVPPNQSKGCAVIQEAKVEHQTLGIFTKMDSYISEDTGHEERDLEILLTDQTRYSFPVGYGWLAASSKKSDIIPQPEVLSQELFLLQSMESTEKSFFKSKYSKLFSSSKLLGLENIRQKIQNKYEVFIRNHWLPVIQTKLEGYSDNVNSQMLKLGYPLPKDPDYLSILTSMSCEKSWCTFFDGKLLNYILRKLFDKVVQSSSSASSPSFDLFGGVPDTKTYFNFSSKHELWKLFSIYHKMFSVTYKPYSDYQSTDKPVFGATVSSRDLSVPLLSYKNDAISLIIDPAKTAVTRKRVVSLLKSVLTDIGEILRSTLTPTEENINRFVSCLLLASNQEITIQPTSPVVQQIHLKIERFPSLLDILKSVVAQRLTEALNEFDIWCHDFAFDSPLMIPEFFSDKNGRVCCLLQWAKPEILHQYPHLMMEKFYLTFSEAFSTKDNIINLEEEDLILLTKESFKNERFELLKQLKEVREVSKAINAFASELDSQLLNNKAGSSPASTQFSFTFSPNLPFTFSADGRKKTTG